MILTKTRPERSLIEDRTLDRLGLEIVDLANYTDESMPNNYPRFHIYRYGRLLGTVSKCGQKYHTRIVNNLAGYNSLFEAVTCWVSQQRLREVEREIIQEIEQNSLPDYF